MNTSTRRERLITAGAWLREQRKARRLTQQSLAMLLGVSDASLSAYERGVSSPDDRTVEQIARVMACPLDEVRERWGLYGVGATEPAAPPSVIEAILADPDLIPEAKQHLQSQYTLLLRLTQPATNRAEVEAATRADLRRARILRQGGDHTVTQPSCPDPEVPSDPSSTVTARKCDATD